MEHAELNAEELAFLRSQGISPSGVLIAPDLGRERAKEIAKARGLLIVLGSRCKKAGHRLRTRSGHCIQCDPSKIAYQKRHSLHGFVYIAGSLNAKLIKVGGTEAIRDRVDRLRSERYGGAGDWLLLLHVELDRYGEAESRAHSILFRHRVEAPYLKDGHEQFGREVYRCSFSIAEAALDKALAELEVQAKRSSRSVAVVRYEF